MIAGLLRAFRQWRIRALEQQMDHACEQFDHYLHDQAEKLDALRRKQCAGQTTEQVARRCSDRARGAL
jgi:hypothetical protein